MKITRHRLLKEDGSPYPFVASPNLGGELESRYLVMHFTAGRSAESSVRWLSNRAAKASAHLVIGRDGAITQLVPFNRIAWHAGRSSWDGMDGLNRYSLGIELDNPGRLVRSGSRWRAWFGVEYEAAEVIEAVHKNGSEMSGWLTYSPLQLDAALEVSSLLMDKYQLTDVVGHDDISPGRKLDPGPAFPMREFRSHLQGRAEDEDLRYQTRTHLNIRSGPATHYDLLNGSPLPPNTSVVVLNEYGSWRFVDVEDVVDGVMDMQGWVHGNYLRRAE